MLHLDKITITHFKNYDQRSFEFQQQVTGICGLNGMGKTNLLDAIYYCCFARSYFSGTEALNINFSKDGFRLEGMFSKDNQSLNVTCINRGSNKKELLLNDVPYEKFSKHIGLLPAVMIAPDDIELVTGKSENRRKYIDTLLCQLDAGYLQQLIVYNKLLQQRNSLLKNWDQAGNSGHEVLEILDRQLVAPANFIHNKRKDLCDELIPLVHRFHKRIADNDEEIFIQYSSQLNGHSFEKLLEQNKAKDIVMQRSNAGIHKDDITIELNGQSFKNIASQGQRKSLLFALKLAEFEILKQHKGFAPLLLLDDVFEKLDNNRMQHLLEWVCKDNDGQVFITDTHRERLEEAFDSLDAAYQVISL